MGLLTSSKRYPMTRTEALAAIRAVDKFADEGGIVRAWHMVDLFPGRPDRHVTVSLMIVAWWLEVDSGFDADELIDSTR